MRPEPADCAQGASLYALSLPAALRITSSDKADSATAARRTKDAANDLRPRSSSELLERARICDLLDH